MSVRDALTTAGISVAVVGGWKLYVVWRHVSPLLLPPPEDVGRALGTLLSTGSTFHDMLITLTEITAGFGLAVACALAIGVVLARLPSVERAMNPFVVALQVTPKVAIVPLLALWLGFGLRSKIVVAAVFAFLPVLTGTIAGLRSVEPHHRDVFRSLRSGRLHALVLLDLPSALPWILTGMEVGIVLATVGAVVAEFLGGEQGLGYLAVSALNQLEVATMFAAVVLLCALGYLLYAAVAVLRRLLVPWHPSAALAGPGAAASG